MTEPIKVLISQEALDMFQTRTLDGRRIEMHLGQPDEDGVCELYFYSQEDESTQAYRDGLAMGKLMAAPAWGAETAWVEWDHQEQFATAKIDGYTTVRGTGKTIEEACNNALYDLKKINALKGKSDETRS